MSKKPKFKITKRDCKKMSYEERKQWYIRWKFSGLKKAAFCRQFSIHKAVFYPRIPIDVLILDYRNHLWIK